MRSPGSGEKFHMGPVGPRIFSKQWVSSCPPTKLDYVKILLGISVRQR